MSPTRISSRSAAITGQVRARRRRYPQSIQKQVLVYRIAQQIRVEALKQQLRIGTRWPYQDTIRPLRTEQAGRLPPANRFCAPQEPVHPRKPGRRCCPRSRRRWSLPLERGRSGRLAFNRCRTKCMASVPASAPCGMRSGDNWLTPSQPADVDAVVLRLTISGSAACRPGYHRFDIVSAAASATVTSKASLKAS